MSKTDTEGIFEIEKEKTKKNKNPTVSFSDTPEKIKIIKEFAVDKGFGKASVLLKYAVYQYMRRYAKHGP